MVKNLLCMLTWRRYGDKVVAVAFRDALEEPEEDGD